MNALDVEIVCDFCKGPSRTPMCDHCAEADEAGVLLEYLAGEVECPACAEFSVWVSSGCDCEGAA